VQPSAAVPPLASFVPVQRKWPLLAAAAAVLVALAGGYVAGTRQTVDVSAGAPPATRIVQAIPFTPTGGHQ
jgi:urease accessory protein UreH